MSGEPHGQGKFLQGRRIIAFIVIFETFSLLIHLYIFSHLFYLLDIDPGIWFWPFILLSSILWLLSMGIGMMSASRPASAFHVASTLWLGLLFMFIFTLVGWDVARQFVDPPKELVGATVIAISLGAMIFGLMNARFVRTKEFMVSTDKVEGEVRVVHLSDVHIGTFYSPKFLRRVVRIANSLKPDFVVITGDLADGAHPYTGETFRPLDELKVPVYYVTGNHEHYAGLIDVLEALSETKVERLMNGTATVGDVQILGIDYWAERDEVARTLREADLDDDRFNLVLYHVPRELKAFKDSGADLVLTGHTHAGQFFPFTMISRAIWKKHKGLHDLGSTHLFVSSGIGTWGPPIRLGTSSQVALVRIMGRGGDGPECSSVC
jgi:predicted MPP superfamily phosphohydrolase